MCSAGVKFVSWVDLAFFSHTHRVLKAISAGERESEWKNVKKKENRNTTKQKAGRGNFMAHLFRVNRKS